MTLENKIECPKCQASFNFTASIINIFEDVFWEEHNSATAVWVCKYPECKNNFNVMERFTVSERKVIK